ncbi:prolipoprotein diacylglyceryl transferase family protein [Kyrpidia sp.]|uniref:prolipoprotein diacylglyceryl transferase family protein n=1 Tax=Kyrpidia sp. TaxID=2073077 RepID=UPI00259030C9|nr:prolipoprotein diacylglyceryl transferase family protein [Kyrpidia sp.]MCL6576835.1 prolipoprotein diacylglyceryl transferase [Kyrpidia sp.]
MLELLGGIHIGPLFLPYRLVGLILAVLAGAWAMRRGPWTDPEARTPRDQSVDEVALTAYWNAAIAGLVGYRFAGLILTPAAWWNEPGRALFSAPPSGSVWVAGAAAGAVLILTALRQRLSIQALLDRLVPSLLLSGAFYSFFALDVGSITNLPWGIPLGDTSRHPVNIYRALLLITAFFIVWLAVSRQRTHSVPPSSIRSVRPTGLAIFLLGAALLTAGYADSPGPLYLGLRPDQWASVALLAIGALSINRVQKPSSVHKP